jgi:hypothetical protein
MSTEQTPSWVVTVTPTIQDGQVVRWYRTLVAAENDLETMSASRNGVLVNGFLHEVGPTLLVIAEDIRRGLAAGWDASHAATHRRTRLFGGDLEPIVRQEATDV